jgi:hypothetical protein
VDYVGSPGLGDKVEAVLMSEHRETLPTEKQLVECPSDYSVMIQIWR